MSHQDKPAFPVIETHEVYGTRIDPGLTKREYFAAQALIGLSSYRPSNLYQWCRWAVGLDYRGSSISPDSVAQNAVACADELFRRLEGTK